MKIRSYENVYQKFINKDIKQFLSFIKRLQFFHVIDKLKLPSDDRFARRFFYDILLVPLREGAKAPKDDSISRLISYFRCKNRFLRLPVILRLIVDTEQDLHILDDDDWEWGEEKITNIQLLIYDVPYFHDC